MISEYKNDNTITINETDWRGNVVCYVQYYWCEVEWVEHDTKFDEEHDKDCIELEFQFQFSKNCAELVRVVK